MDFFDEDDDLDQPRPRGGSRASGGTSSSSSSGDGSTPTREQIRLRQAALAIGAIVLLILIVIAFRGCLDARKDRSFQNYVSDLSSITSETDQLSTGFFDRLNGKTEVDGVTFQSEVDGDKGTAQGLLDRAEGLDAPDELGAAQEQIELSYELRHDALEGIASQVGRAQSKSAANDASQAIYTQMKVLSASDILFARAKDQIEQALADQEVTVEEGVPSSQFLPDEPDYLDPKIVDAAVSTIAGGGGGGTSGAACPGNDPGDKKTHGLGLPEGGVSIDGTPLDPSTTTTVTGGKEIQVDVQNQGETDESDITVEVSGGGIEGSQQIGSIAANETQSVSIPLQPAPKGGQSVDLDVSVAPVCGEQVETNNKATYSVTF